MLKNILSPCVKTVKRSIQCVPSRIFRTNESHPKAPAAKAQAWLATHAVNCMAAYLGTVCLTVHGLDGSREVSTAVPVLVRWI